jgi:hypothetical protein
VVELRRLLRQGGMNPQEVDSLCCRSASHSTGMGETELVAVLDGSVASIVDMPSMQQPVVMGLSET